MSKVLCIGELLWDMIPSGKEVGGAPFNVAYHLKKLGIDSLICTKVGKDDDGDELLRFVENQDIDISLIQRDPNYPTSIVQVIYDDREGVKYDIVKPVAWDYIATIECELQSKDYLLYGSLIFRSEVSKQTVLTYLKNTSALKVFDINLRYPHYDKDTLLEVLQHTDILKLNERELKIVLAWSGLELGTSQGIKYLISRYGLKEVICTLGAKGAYCYTNQSDKLYFVDALKVEVVDTIGSGDAFLAGYLSARVQQKELDERLRFATEIAGFVSSKKGGCPAYTLEAFNKFQLES